ncbi:MAG: methyl-accepting chemotaxis protein [Natronospirillum sp.]|uniref:methyl-accepting chemotaxis protein n=1 Tax=Natronospirillum sp. TaxID=2812955 RepID=UPI0025DC1F11|nr:methyl-accepting chemotaxis protein [Natronospirillum sp.]MCH8551702.1 methyl-accepting chemotaxis protein [Natronospirillum sp.]
MKANSSLWSILATNRTLSVYLILALILLLGVGAFITLINRDANFDREYLANASDLKVLSQELSKNATEAAAGSQSAFLALRQSRNDFQTKWDIIVNGNAETGLPPVNRSVVNIDSLENVWQRVRVNADQILVSESTIISLFALAATVAERIPVIQVENDAVVEILLDEGSDAAQVAIAQRQNWLAERIIRNVNNVLSGGEAAVLAANSFSRDSELFGQVLQGLINGNPDLGLQQITDAEAQGHLDNIQTDFERISGSVDELLETSTELFQVRDAATQIFDESQALLDAATAVEAQIELLPQNRIAQPQFAIIMAIGVIALIVLAIWEIYRAQTMNLKRTEEENEQNQNAILRLLDELADLADGDLTTQATVTEDFTGAIADSINFAIDQMRQLVAAINATAVQVSSAAQETQTTARQLADASEHQAQEIAGASAAVNEMAVSIDQVSANAAESSAVAERSVSIAKKGSDVVQATINGMDNIREQIQETSKRIKRLGESSQEIGDIVSLINDIADQTNILSLNAAIQASMAGDAGRGFAVVADEVQRLAERSSAATKQIEALVKNIQSDTNEAVISMEQTTSEVVRGARLAQDAGVALEEIENVSRSLADLIQNISNAARQQASSAGHISNTMNVIQEITSQTSAGTTATAESIGNLANLAKDMRASVAGFKLPEAEEGDDDLDDLVELPDDKVSAA